MSLLLRGFRTASPSLQIIYERLSSVSPCLSQFRQSHCLCKHEPIHNFNWGVDLQNEIFVPSRNTSFFNRVTAAQLWKGVTSVSNAGRKRGRGKGVGRKIAKDLNKGQVIGFGKINMVWPGLNAPVIQGKELVEQRELPPDTEREAKILKMRDSMGVFRPLRLSPLERGWSGTKMHGRSIGPPDPIGQDAFEGFDTKVLEMKTVTCMDGNIGRRKRFSVLAFTGNKNGLAGFAIGKCPDGRVAMRRAKNRAGQKLVYIERFQEHTVLHDFFTQFGATKIYVYKKYDGFGLVCHRAIKTMCEVIGIKDLYAKIEGSVNVQNMVKAFMLGLLRQKTYQQIADQKKLFLVEQRAENMYMPTVLAAPMQCRTELEIPSTESLDFANVVLDGKIIQKRKKWEPPYSKLPSYEVHLRKTQFRRNFGDVKVRLHAEYGGSKSHLTKKHPECDRTYPERLHFKKLEAANAESDN